MAYIRNLVLLLAAALFFAGCSTRQVYETPKFASTSSPTAVNLNTASANELEKLPHIGKTLAARIVEFRETNGPFRKPEHLILVQGISDKRFREIRDSVKAE
jgi:competence ComEA-like helix-hairpin-helix protein